MKLTIDFGEPILAEENILAISPRDLNDFYADATDFDKNNIFFMMLTSLQYFEEKKDYRKAAHLSFLIAYYLFIDLTPPGSCQLALHYINHAVSLFPSKEYREWLELIKKGN